jgi:release factor glutamine methyltransferase
LAGPVDIILANPPYLPSSEASVLAAAWGEPLMALDGGTAGLDFLNRLVAEATGRLARGGFLLLESDPRQASRLRSLFIAGGFEAVETGRDLGGLERVTSGRLR